MGYYFDVDLVGHGFLFKNGILTTIDDPLATSDTQAYDLNDRGQTVGLYERARAPRPGASDDAAGPYS